MQDTTTNRRLLPYTSAALAGVALALSTWTACQSRSDSAEATVDSAVQGERSTKTQQEKVAEQNAPGKARSTAEPSAAAGAQAVQAAVPSEKSGATPASAEPDEPKKSTDVPPEVKRLVLATDVQDREPLPLDGAAPAGEPLTAFVELANAADAPAEVVVTFEHVGGQKVGFVELSVPASSPRYRTWARTRHVRTAGTWHAVVTHKGGEELARQSFTVEAPSPEKATVASETAQSKEEATATASAGDPPEAT